MYEVLIREAAVRFGLGDKALPVLQMLLAYMTAKDNGGLLGFLEKFKAAGGGPSAQTISNSQLETVLGSSGGLLSQVSGKLELGRDNVTAALGYLLPVVVGKLTPGGSLPGSLPPEVQALAAAGEQLIAAPAAAAASGGGSGGLLNWLPWVVVVLAALFGLSYCGKEKAPAPAPAAVEAPASAPAAPQASDAAPATVPAPAEAPPASEAQPAASEPASAASTPGSAAAASDEDTRA